ncbi:MAG TPA: protein-glutamate O-methyltransferase [Geobacteraceae bacterium]
MSKADNQKRVWSPWLTAAGMSEQEFRRFSSFIYRLCGIKMPHSKKTMLEARLQKRLRVLGLTSFEEYAAYLFSPVGQERELPAMIDVVTTNKTEFFREPAHFDYLVGSALPQLMADYHTGLRRSLAVWSAGCSSGEEAYTLAMVLSEFAEQVPGFRFDILATDISTKVLDMARLAIYEERVIEQVTPPLRHKYFLRSKNKAQRQVRVVPHIRSRVSFERVNFMEEDYGVARAMDIIFCRNVIIYFDKETQQNFLRRLCNHLVPGGYLFLGHSETLSGLDVPLVQIASTIYRKPA